MLFTLRELIRGGRELDVLLAIKLVTLEIDWEYRDGGKFSAGVVANKEGIFLPNSAGEILRF